MAVFGSIPVPFRLPRAYPPTIQGGPSGKSARMTFDININDMEQFIEYIAGTEEEIDIGGGNTVTRIVPLRHPNMPDLYVVGFNSVAVGGTGGEWESGMDIYTPMFSTQRLHVDFATMPFGVAGDQPYYTWNSEHATEYEPVPFGGMIFPNNFRTTGEYAIPVGVTAFRLTTFMNMSPVTSLITNMVGRVNFTTFQGYAPGHVHFASVASEFAFGMYSRSVTKSMIFKVRERSWQEALDNEGNWEVPVSIVGGLPKFPTAEFNTLLYA